MSTGWYRTVDGGEHELHLHERWTGSRLGEGQNAPGGPAVPFAAVDGAQFARALVETARAIPAPESGQLVGQLFTWHTESGPHLLVCVSDDRMAIVRSIDAAQAMAGETSLPFWATLTSEAFASLTGPVQLSLGADEDWDAMLIAGPTPLPADAPRIYLPRRRPPLMYGRVNGDLLSSATVAAGELQHLIAATGDLASVSLVLAPGRLIVRGPAGMIGAIEAPTGGEPAVFTTDGERLRRGIASFSRPEASLVVGLSRVGEDGRKLRVTSDADGAYLGLQQEGWIFT